MKLCNISVAGETHLALVTSRGIVDLQAAGYKGSMMELISGGQVRALDKYAQDESLPVVERPVFANVVEPIGKLVCVGLNYRAHASGVHMKIPEYPILFSKFANALVPCGAPVELPPWESSYASKYIKLCPGDLIYTGTPSGVALEGQEKHWLKPGDVVDVDIEGIGILRNSLV